jgi:hypothetical protein
MVIKMNSKFSDEDRQRILRESYSVLERADEALAGRPRDDAEAPLAAPDDPLAEAMARPLESFNDRARREIAEQEAAWAAERRADRRGLAERLVALEQRVERDGETIANLRADLLDVATAAGKAMDAVSDALDDLRSEARRPSEAANERVEALFSRLESKLDAIRKGGSDDGTVVELPNVLQ